MAKTLKGIAASDGIAIASAYRLVEPDLSFTKASVDDVDQEAARFEKAVETSIRDVESVRDIAKENLGEEEAQVFEARLLTLNDPEYIGVIKQEIKDSKADNGFTLDETSQKFITIFESTTDNEHMKERAADIRNASERIMAHLLGKNLPNPTTIDHEVVVVAHDLTPSDTAQLNKDYVKGFVTDIGGRTAHSVIMARSLELSAIVGTDSIASDTKDGQLLVVDGLDGLAVIEPSDREVADYKKKGEAFLKQKAEWKKLKDAPSVTKDGKHSTIAANIGTPDNMAGVLENDAEAVGLYRTEFLYMSSSELPSEDDQFEAYKKVIEGMDGKQIVIRTIDTSGDKHLSYLPPPEEMGPFLGHRTMRISLKEDQILRIQLRALLRTSAYGRSGIMFPMIGTLAELHKTKATFNEEKEKLVKDGVKIGDDIQVDMMIEVPTAAILADQFAKEVDFFSIGTNDLIQYTFAADRGNEHVSYLYQPYNPSLLRLTKHTIDAAHDNEIWCGMCSEVAGDSIVSPLLLAMGLDEYLISTTSILRIRSQMKKFDTKDLEGLVDKAINESLINEDNQKLVEDLMSKLNLD